MYTTLTQTNIASTKNRFTDHILVVMSREDLSRWLGSFSAIPPRNRQVGFSFTSSEVKKANPPTVIPWGSEMDIVSFVDNFVGGWLRDTRPNSTQAEISDILATANRVKQAFLDPDSVSSLMPPAITSPPLKSTASYFHRSTLNSTMTNLGFTNSSLEEARAIVRLAQKEANARNKDRIGNPRVNNYYGKESSKLALKSRANDAQLLAINATVAAAAALVAEADAAHSNTTEKDYSIPIEISRNEQRNLEKRAGSYWLENMNHVGRIPFGGPDNDNYPVFRNVKDYGAVGNGKVDDTAAINRAMTDGNRCGAKCGASSIKGAVVYFPAGKFSRRDPTSSILTNS